MISIYPNVDTFWSWDVLSEYMIVFWSLSEVGSLSVFHLPILDVAYTVRETRFLVHRTFCLIYHQTVTPPMRKEFAI